MLSQRMSQLSPSGIRRVMAMSQQMEDAGETVVHMEVGQPHFGTPNHVLESASSALLGGIPGYTPNLGLPTLREAIAEKVSGRARTTIGPESVCVTSGAVMAIAVAIQAIVDPGDEVLVPDPGWPNYRSAIAVAGGVPVPYALDPARGFLLDVEELESRLTSRTRMILINSPANPTGTVADPDSIAAVRRLAEERGLYVLSDEIYEDIVFEGQHESLLAEGLTERSLLVSGVSKSYAMTGWRIGWLVASESLINSTSKLIEPLTSCPVTVSQLAAEAALRGPQVFTERMRRAYAQASDVVEDVLGPLGVLPARPGGAFYGMVDVSQARQSSDEFVADLLEEERVAVAPGSTFGSMGEGYVRISTALDVEDLREGCQRIRRYLERRGN